jgi:hypothetical protein
MTNVFGKEFQATLIEPRGTWQGRSKEKLRVTIKHDGRILVARWEGSPVTAFLVQPQRKQITTCRQVVHDDRDN